MTTISAQIPDELFESLRKVAKQVHRSNSYLIREALANHLAEIKEDTEDTNDAIRILAEGNASFPMEEVFKDLNID